MSVEGKKTRKIVVVTGSRAEYGLLKPLLGEIEKDTILELQLIVTGMHLSPKFGFTYDEIEKDGFHIDKAVEMILSSDTETGMANSVGLGIINLSQALKDLNPDLVLLLGDRFEILSAAVSSLFLRIPLAHISGGEITKGAIDNEIRHAITKMSDLHFTSTKEYRARVEQMGEPKERVFVVGEIGLDNIHSSQFSSSRKELEKTLEIDLSDEIILATLHPETKSNIPIKEQIETILSTLSAFEKYVKIFTYPNADSGGHVIIKNLEDFVASTENSYSFASLGRSTYLNLLNCSSVMIGNSSSGIIEAPSFHLPVINIGRRQEGRIKPENVIDVTFSKLKIKKALEKGLSKEFKDSISNINNPYWQGGAAEKIVKTLKNVNLLSLKQKEFVDI